MSCEGSFARAIREGDRAALVTVVSAADEGLVGAKMFVRADASWDGTLGDAELNARAAAIVLDQLWLERSQLHEIGSVTVFVDVTAPPPRLLIFGAVDFAAAVCRIGRGAGFRPYVIDARARFATPERFPAAEQVVVGWPGDALTQLGGIDRATYIAVLTHDPKLDDAALSLAVASDAPYIGAMGSRRATAERRRRLGELGVPAEAIARISAPIGLDLGGVTAEETALSIIAEIVAVRNGRAGGRLSQSAAPRIHEIHA